MNQKALSKDSKTLKDLASKVLGRKPTDESKRESPVNRVDSSGESANRGDESPGRSTWRSLYPHLDPSEWEVDEKADCIIGRKVRGRMSGVIAFLIPREKL